MKDIIAREIAKLKSEIEKFFETNKLNEESISIIIDNDYIVVDNNYKTNIDNVYAVGDIIKKEVYQLTTATSEATIASIDIIKKLNN